MSLKRITKYVYLQKYNIDIKFNNPIRYGLLPKPHFLIKSKQTNGWPPQELVDTKGGTWSRRGAPRLSNPLSSNGGRDEPPCLKIQQGILHTD